MSMFGGGTDYEGACDLYVQAANASKLQKNWRKAAECYIKAANAQEHQKEISRQASYLQEAGHVLKRISPDEAAVVYSQAADLYNTSGRFGQSARMLKSVAEAFEAEGNIFQAMNYYKKASDYFEMDEYGKSSYTACILKYAEYASKLEKNYKEAVKIFEQEGEKALRNSVIQFGAKDHFLKAGILRLAIGDVTDMKIALERYEETDPRFAPSREGKLLRACVMAYEEQNEEAYVGAIQEYDSITRLDPWRVHFLYQAREALNQTCGGAPTIHLEEDEEGEVDLS